MRNANKETVQTALQMIETLEAGGKVALNQFLPVYNRITGRREKGGCATCWKNRIVMMKQCLGMLKGKNPDWFEASTPQPAKEEVKVEPAKEESPKKKRRGRPRKTDK